VVACQHYFWDFQESALPIASYTWLCNIWVFFLRKIFVHSRRCEITHCVPDNTLCSFCHFPDDYSCCKMSQSRQVICESFSVLVKETHCRCCFNSGLNF
jgi:hypothetical protein